MSSITRRLAAWTTVPERLLWAVRVRWLTIGGFLVLSLLARGLGVFSSFSTCFGVAVVGAGLNAANGWCVRRQRWVVRVSAVAIPMDHVFTTYLVMNTGGAQSPFVVLYVVQVLATAMLVDTVIAAASALFAIAAWFGAMQLHQVGFWGLEDLTASVGSRSYQAVLAGFWLYCLTLLIYLGGYISDRLRISQTDLAARNLSLEDSMASLSTAHDEINAAYERLRSTEAQLLQSEKLRGLGQLVAGVAHELNNPISFISANVEHLRTYTGRFADFAAACAQLAGDDVVRRQLATLRQEYRLDDMLADLPGLLDDCEEGARRSKQIVQELRTFSRDHGRAEWSRVDLRRGLESTLSLLTHRLHDRICVHRAFGGQEDVDGLAGPLNQVFMNLLANAIDAIGDRSGNIWIETLRHAGHVEVSIRDDGCGMSTDVQARVFDPFFTTKEVGRGTGLGLSVSYGIVERHGGVLRVVSQPGNGSTFTVQLPVKQQQASAA